MTERWGHQSPASPFTVQSQAGGWTRPVNVTKMQQRKGLLGLETIVGLCIEALSVFVQASSWEVVLNHCFGPWPPISDSYRSPNPPHFLTAPIVPFNHSAFQFQFIVPPNLPLWPTVPNRPSESPQPPECPQPPIVSPNFP